jgi:hypothetical protein
MRDRMRQQALAFVAVQERMPANKYEWAGSLLAFNEHLVDLIDAVYKQHLDHMAICTRPQIFYLGPSSLEKKS